MSENITVPKIMGMKAKRERIVCVTAYDQPTGLIADQAGVDLILVGDSVGNVVLGFQNTLAVTLEMMEHHTSAVAKGVNRALVIADMPFGSYQSSVGQAVDSAVRLMRCGASGVKLEGDFPEHIAAIVKAGIPVMGHVGMTPQSFHAFGGFRIQGKGEMGETVVQHAHSIGRAGAFAVVLELVPKELAGRLTAELHVPTIGIGAGIECDGQIQVFHDIMGLSPTVLRHAKRYAEGAAMFSKSLKEYAQDVREGTFPGEDQSF